ncbi:MAG: hypothetical protein CM1200mP5_0590 [Candidatus Pelagibacterales bacterium]|nr:MAG: hypothetical protein CM1200mP5_0590 [Pelagibacterales bacterium]
MLKKNHWAPGSFPTDAEGEKKFFNNQRAF